MFAVVAAFVGVLAAAPPSAERVREHVDAVLADKDYQTQLPGRAGNEAVPWTQPSDIGAGEHDRQRRKRRQGDREIDAGGFGAFASILMYVLMFAAIAALIIWLATELSGYWRDRPAADKETLLGSDADAVIARPLGDAEALAGQGRFGDAIHTLLLRTLSELSARLERPLPPALTSREILREVAVPDDARTALAGLITAVEVSHFGDVVPGAAEYQHCLASFRRFAAAYTRGRP